MVSDTVLVDYGAGNLRSVEKALLAAGAPRVTVTADPDIVARADRIVLPGVGAFGACAGALRAVPGLEPALTHAVIANARPFLGICVGMQLMADEGREYGAHAGLGWIPGHVERLTPADPALKIPHMGWNMVTATGPNLVETGGAYFVHSYVVRTADPAHILATTTHGEAIVAAIGRANLLGVQFHPEKSQAYGLALLTRWLNWRP
ncbi:imidazole glycerol phosphate synthase subunit HisH [Sandaracinobacteroides saxicola]|uniref:imidazole glycerol phosphate synthase subunit HisH n=1 Tax=Sandaracinobacteroides saxicola TaxID=2759707 RepID=UPI001FB07ECA|nr:imidazole glycerol phosphate synthase subunit HisH [Sandaracinobacteroides saxicola]